MEEQIKTEQSRRIEQQVLRQRRIQSDKHAYLLVLFAVLLLMLGYAFLSGFSLTAARIYQVGMLVALVAVGYVLVSKRLTVYRYVLDAERFMAYRCIGKRQRIAADAPIGDITGFFAYKAPKGEASLVEMLSGKKKEQSQVLAYKKNGRQIWLVLSPDEDLRQGILDALGQNETTP